MNERLFLNISGSARAGKSTTCAHLAEKYGFSVVKISDLIRVFALDEGLTLGPRSDYLAVHLQMKQKLGADIIAKTLLDEPSNKVCVDGLRVPKDRDRLHQAPNVSFYTIALVCPLDLRYARSRQENSPLDQGTYSDFLAEDIEDGYSPDPERQNTDAIVLAADYHVDSSRPKPEVLADVEAIVEPMLQRIK